MPDLNEKQSPINRLSYKGDIAQIIKRLCEKYDLGLIKDYSIIAVGYEDCNVNIRTEKGVYLAKMFAKTRTSENITRYSNIIERISDAGIHHPKLLKTKKGEIVYTDSGVNLVLLNFVEGKTFLDLNRAPNSKELRDILEQAAKINTIDYKPEYLFDSWAIINIEKMFEKTKQYIDKNDIILIEKVIEKFDKIPIKKLPHCFVHGDFTKANVVKGNDGKVYILDFSVSNWYPRIQELAVIAANLAYDENSPQTLQQRCKNIVDEYSKFNKLTSDEIEHLPAYALAGSAMEFMGAHQEKFIKGNDTEETNYWLNLGREGLRSSLINL